jgi:hypothetical protein
LSLGSIVAILAAFYEEYVIGRVAGRSAPFDPDSVVIVVGDCSGDPSAKAAVTAGVAVVRLLFNLGIGTAVHTGFEYGLSRRAATLPCGWMATGGTTPGSPALLVTGA